MGQPSKHIHKHQIHVADFFNHKLKQKQQQEAEAPTTAQASTSLEQKLQALLEQANQQGGAQELIDESIANAELDK